MKVFNRKQLQDWDRYTIDVDKIDSLDLIHRAGTLLGEEIESLMLQHDHSGPVRIFCGLGNNGADGLVVGMYLSDFIGDLEVYVVQFKEAQGLDFAHYRDKAELNGLDLNIIYGPEDFPALGNDTVVIDALFGTGITRPLEGLTLEVVEHINSSSSYLTIAIDHPSGLPTDEVSQSQALQADYTLSIASYKLSCFFAEHAKYTGAVILIPLELSQDYYNQTAASNQIIELHDILMQDLKMDAHAYKNSFGHTLFVGGSKGKMGAAVLAAEGALRAGCGLVTAHVPSCGVDIVQVALPEAMVSTDMGKEKVLGLPAADPFQAGCIGCGLGMDVEARVLEAFLHLQIPKVLDADALNILSENKSLFHLLDSYCILTPHIGEFHRLFGICQNSFERYKKLV